MKNFLDHEMVFCFHFSFQTLTCFDCYTKTANAYLVCIVKRQKFQKCCSLSMFEQNNEILIGTSCETNKDLDVVLKRMIMFVKCVSCILVELIHVVVLGVSVVAFILKRM